MATVHEQVQDKYELVGKLREGGMGALFLVRHKLLGEQRVVKIMRPQWETDQEFAMRFVREAQTLIRVRHPHIAQLYDFFADEAGNAAMVMEYIPGIDLRELLRRHGPPSLGLALEIAYQSLDAIGFLHRRQMVHRDISPDNLMLSRDADGRPLVKLIDLGIVKVPEGETTGLTSTGMFIGKVRYASPEQFQTEGGTKLDQRSDLYSFGVVFYELLTGRLPVVGDTASALIAGHLYHPPLGFDVTDPQGRVSEELRQLVMAMLAKTPAQRPATAEAVQAQIRELKQCYPFSLEELDTLIPKEVEPPTLVSVLPPVPGASSGKPEITSPTASLAATIPTAPQVPPPAPSQAQPLPQALPSAKSPKRLGLWVSGLLVAGALAVGGYLAWPHFTHRGTPLPPPSGVLVLHAVPWARVIKITNAQGQEVPLPSEAVTPLTLPLPAGTYTVALAAPEGGATTSTTVRILAGTTTRTVVPLGVVSPEEFLKRLGWR